MQSNQITAIGGLLTSLAVALSGVTCAAGTAGCQADAVGRAFGFTEPGISAEYSPLLGSWRIRVASNFTGEARFDLGTNGAITAYAKVESNASDVTESQGNRINENFLEARRVEWDGKERQAVAVGQNFVAFGAMVAQVTNSVGKEAAVPIVSEIAALLRGSGGAIDLPGLGSGSVRLGESDGRLGESDVRLGESDGRLGESDGRLGESDGTPANPTGGGEPQ